tara:strand:+ start:120 stop:641 length:522 start_codon:yes stop_codon:yes gene_type:complete
MLSILAKLLQALNSENSTRQIALAIALALIFALSPLVSIQAMILLLIVLLIKVNFASFLVATAMFKGVNIVLAPISIAVGEWLLTANSTSGLFASLYQFDWFKLAQWHHTYNIGALVVGVLLAIPVYFIAQILIAKYRQHIKTYFEKLPLVKALKASRVFQLYQQLPSNIGEK